MKKSSKILLLVVTIIAIFMIMIGTSFAETNNDYSYTIFYDETIKITGYTGDSIHLEIPSMIDGYPVTGIGNNAFYNNDNLQSVTIPDSVISIDKEAFAYCSNLQNITLPSTIEIIYYGAFRDCTNLENVYYQGTADDWMKIIFDRIDSNPMYYAENEYFNGELVTNIVLSENIIELNSNAFCNCKSLKSIIIKNRTVYIGSGAFEGCINLWHVLYAGTEEQWNKLYIGSNNSCLIDATRHYEVSDNPITETITQPTCTEKGFTTYTCECGDSYIDDYVDETGHSYNSVVTPPSCTEQGYSTHTCKCGDSYVDSFVNETGHSYGEWIVTKVATTNTEGEMERICTCGDKEYKTIDKLSAVEDDEKYEQGDINIEDARNPEIPNTNYGVVSSAYIVYMFILFFCVVAMLMLVRRRCYK